MDSITRRVRWRYKKLLWRLRRGRVAVRTLQAARLGGLAVAPVVMLAASLGLSRPGQPIVHSPASGSTLTWRTWSDVALGPVQATRQANVARFGTRFGIDAELAAMIYDAAVNEGVDPALAFPLVRVESSFRRYAVGPAGAIGLAQVQPRTARWLDSSITREALFEAETNLRIGFRYLRLLLDRYRDDTRLALLAYNRGPGTVGALLAMGQDPANGYASRILGTATPAVFLGERDAS